MAMRKVVLVLLAIFFFSFAHAMSISVEDKILEGVQWSFSVELDSFDGIDEEKVFIEDDLIATVIEYEGEKIVPESTLSSKVLGYLVSDDTITLSMASMSSGDYTIYARTYSNGGEQEEASAEVEFITPLTSTEKKELQDQISDLQNAVSTLESEINSKSSQIEALKEKNDSLLSSVKSLQDKLSILEAEEEENEAGLSVLNDDLNALLEEQERARKANPINALFALNEETNGLAFGGILVVVVIVVVVLVLRSRGTSIYSSGSGALSRFRLGKSREADAGESPKRKWAVDKEKSE